MLPMALGVGQFIARVARVVQFRARGVIEIVTGAEGIGVETSAPSDAPGLFPSITQGQADGVVRHAGLDPDRPAHGAIAQLDLDGVIEKFLILGEALRENAQIPGRFGAEQNGVVPSQFGDRVGQFLQPAVVVVAAVIHLGIAIKNDIQLALGRRGAVGFNCPSASVNSAGSCCTVAGGDGAAGQDSRRGEISANYFRRRRQWRGRFGGQFRRTRRESSRQSRPALPVR